MKASIKIVRAGPLVTVQDIGRVGMLGSGISASGPMDRLSWYRAGEMLSAPSLSGLEFTQAGLDFTVISGKVEAAFSGGSFTLKRNGEAQSWRAILQLQTGDNVSITPGAKGNYGYVRFGMELSVPMVMGSRATNLIVGLGGYEGRALKVGDQLQLIDAVANTTPETRPVSTSGDGPVRVIWGVHANMFDANVRQKFLEQPFKISPRLDRMGVRLDDAAGVFADARFLSLVSDSVIPGDIQILGDGTPIVLMRDHQPTGGYPRIATIIGADLDRFAQMRAGTEVHFESVTLDHAQQIARQVAHD